MKASNAGTVAGASTTICITPNGQDLSDTLDASYFKGVGSRNGNERPVVCAGFMGGQGAKAGGIAYSEGVSPTVKAGQSGTNTIPDVVCMNPADSRIKECGGCSPQINAKAGTGGGNLPLVRNAMTVRRLLPIECERLMGFPDNHTRIPWHGKTEDECPDSPRYKACGNSMCVNVMRWIGMRIELVERKGASC